MTASNEIRALQASLLGTLETARALEGIQSKVMDIEPDSDIATDDLEELGRLALAHAVAAQALRGLVEAMRLRRGGG
ncbi:MAG TPA: hypothetical protein VFT39_02015 [Vicinamibacterales bacterium]|nr:hypothetical protein [Vicinamibacterales bacterium]